MNAQLPNLGIRQACNLRRTYLRPSIDLDPLGKIRLLQFPFTVPNWTQLLDIIALWDTTRLRHDSTNLTCPTNKPTRGSNVNELLSVLAHRVAF